MIRARSYNKHISQSAWGVHPEGNCNHEFSLYVWQNITKKATKMLKQKAKKRPPALQGKQQGASVNNASGDRGWSRSKHTPGSLTASKLCALVNSSEH